MKGIFIPTDIEKPMKVVDYSDPLYLALGEAVDGFFEIVNIALADSIKKPRLIVNDCGAINGMELNIRASLFNAYSPIFGPAIIMKEEFTEDGPDIVGLTDKEIEALGF